jgi:hypothetical protein
LADRKLASIQTANDGILAIRAENPFNLPQLVDCVLPRMSACCRTGVSATESDAYRHAHHMFDTTMETAIL